MTDPDTQLRRIAEALVAAPPDVPDWPLDAPLVSLGSPPRRWLVPAIAAATITAAGAGTLVWSAGRGDPERAPLNSPPPPTSSLPATPSAVQRPTAFPVVDDVALEGAEPRGSYSQLGFDNPRSVSALIARPVGDRLVDAVAIAAEVPSDGKVSVDTPPPTSAASDSNTVVWGRPAEVSIEPGPQGPTSVVVEGEPALSFRGADPMRFLDSALPDTVRAELVEGADPDVTLHIGSLPDGYELIAGPEPLALGSIQASLSVGGTATTEGSGIFVGVADPRIEVTVYEPLVAVDVNGADAWMTTRRGFAVMWKVDDRTWVTVAGNESRAAALELARAVSFVDEATWRERYDVAEPGFPDE
jgi:hypothetical protein